MNCEQIGYQIINIFLPLFQFILAGPILSFIFDQSWRFLFKDDHHRHYAMRLGLTHFGMDPSQRAPPFDCYGKRGLPRQCFVYVVHALGLATFCLFFIHVQGTSNLLVLLLMLLLLHFYSNDV